MKILEHIETIHTKTVMQLDENVLLNVSMVGTEILTYSFSKNGVTLHHIENIELYKKAHWSEHPDLLSKEWTFITLHPLINVDVNKLYYVGSYFDGMLKNVKDEPVSSVIRCDDTFSSICLKVSSLSLSNKYKNILEKYPYVSNLKIVKIPVWNSTYSEGGTHTVVFDVLLPDEEYQKYLSGKESLDDQTQVRIVEDLLHSTQHNKNF